MLISKDQLSHFSNSVSVISYEISCSVQWNHTYYCVCQCHVLTAGTQNARV